MSSAQGVLAQRQAPLPPPPSIAETLGLGHWWVEPAAAGPIVAQRGVVGAATATSAGVDDEWTARRPPLLRVCAGESMLLSDDEVDLIELANTAEGLSDPLLDDRCDPDRYWAAEVAMEYYCTIYGVQRHAKGDRVEGVASTFRRYLIPFLVELDAVRPAECRGVAALRLPQLEILARILAGERALPAATVAGDRLKRRAIACLHLSLPDAGKVSVGGDAALRVAVAEGRVSLVRDSRTGIDIVAAIELRRAGLLIETSRPHGLERASAVNVLRDLELVIARARDHGARVRGTFKLRASEPLPANRLRAKQPDKHYIGLDAIAATATHLPVTGQVVLWMARLLGLRIGETYGPHLTEYVRDDDGRPWLIIHKQGGVSSLGRDPQTGKFVRQNEKEHTKSRAGVRTIPIPRHLAALLDALIAGLHTDRATGTIDWTARLIPGIRCENSGGQSSFRTWLKSAQEQTNDAFDPHDLRAALITDLMDAGVDPRLAHYYAGHEQEHSSIQDKHYDLGPWSELLHPIADLLDAKIAAELASTDLRAPTDLRETWGRATRRHRQAGAIEQYFKDTGWTSGPESDTQLGRLMKPSQVAATIGRSLSHTRRLLRTGEIVGHREPLGERDVWVACEADVDRYLQQSNGVTVADLSTELDCTYHQVWQLLRDLDLVNADHAARTPLRLSPAAADAVRAEMGRRCSLAREAVTLAEAATLLDLNVASVETLLRRGQLTPFAYLGGSRRYVTRSSVEEYNQTYPPGRADKEQDQAPAALLTFTEARRLLRISRPELSSLIACRQVRTGRKAGSRHMYVDAASAVAWTQRHRCPQGVPAIPTA